MGLRAFRRAAMPGLGRGLRLGALAVGLAVPAFVTVTLQRQYDQALAGAEIRASNEARALEQHAARTFETIDTFLQAVVSLLGPRIDSLPGETVHDALRNKLTRSRHLNNLMIIDQSGKSIVEADKFPARPLNVFDRDYFQAARSDPKAGLVVGQLIIGRLTGARLLPVARRIDNPDGSFAGVIQAMLEPEAFQSVYDAIDDGPQATLNLWRADGTLLVRSPQDVASLGRNYASHANYRLHVPQRDTAPFWSTGVTDDVPRVIALGFLEHYPLYVGATLGRGDVLAEWRKSAVIQVATAGGLTLVLVLALLRLAREVERRRASDARIRASEGRYRLLAENTTDVIVRADRDATRRYVSPAARSVFGFEPDELVGTNAIDFVHPEDRDGYRATLGDLSRGSIERVVCQYRHRRKDGSYVWLEGSFCLTRDPSGHPDGYVATLRDVTARKEAESQIAHMAVHDALTGLPNRLLFRDRLDQQLASAKRNGGRFAVLACDLDRFKAVNDTLGHPAGDKLLCAIAGRLTAVVRDSDTVARLGGDEFAVILSAFESPQAVSLTAQRIIETVCLPVDLDGDIASVGVSIGIALGSAEAVDADSLFKNADIALYRSKAAGRNTSSFYEEGMDALLASRSLLERDLRAAIRGGGFLLQYQPIMTVAGESPGGFEALLRWPHPERGLIPPAEFIPLAEETGLIVPLGEWVLREACREAAGWPGSLRVAVNVSAVQFRKPGLEQAVVGALAAAGLAAHRLELEITEGVLMSDVESVIACLHRLRALGVRIALDDFGTGYSSLSYLRRFPFDKIKIDRSFVNDIADPDTAAIVRAIVGLGERLGTAITAEGVETDEQLGQVRQEGCTEVQGFLFSRPLSAADALTFIDAQPGRAAA